MRYYQEVLREGETLAFACRLHWIVFARSLGFLGLALVAWLVSLGIQPGGLAHMALSYCALACLVLAPIYAMTAWVRWYSTEIAVTDRRVIYKRGMISRRSVEMNVSKIETVDVEQGPLARLLNYGDVIIRGTGGTFEPLRTVAAPITLRNSILA